MIGNDTLSGSVAQFYGGGDPVASRLLLWFQPALADGDPGSTPNVDAGADVNLINADIKPTARFRLKRLKPLAGSRLWMAIKLPNSGRLRIGDAQVKVPAPGWRKLTATRPEGARLRIGFTPGHGSTFTRAVAMPSANR